MALVGRSTCVLWRSEEDTGMLWSFYEDGLLGEEVTGPSSQVPPPFSYFVFPYSLTPAF